MKMPEQIAQNKNSRWDGEEEHMVMGGTLE